MQKNSDKLNYNTNTTNTVVIITVPMFKNVKRVINLNIYKKNKKIIFNNKPFITFVTKILTTSSQYTRGRGEIIIYNLRLPTLC